MGYYLQILHIFLQNIFLFNLISFSVLLLLSGSLFLEAVQIKIPLCLLPNVAGSMVEYVLEIKPLEIFTH